MRDPAALFARVPVNRTLGFTLVSCGEGQAVLTMPVREEYLQENGYLQGGLVSAVADTAAAYALLPGLPEGRGMTGVEFKVNFLRPTLPNRGDLTARAKVVRQGRTIGVCQVDVEQEGRAVAVATFTYLFFDRPPRQPA
ncbi:MAG TPA: PaaI family thioesterase [Thermoanaerobaculia bacterium]|nr:PaaI family thioesterase [Thermoanaerobaculia bacterium]